MSGKSVQPRPPQIAELTRGQTLPLGAIPDIHLEVIADHLEQAWGELLHTYAGELSFDDEVEVNSLLCSRLNNLEDPRWKLLVSNVVRDQSVVSYDGSHLEKSPDLSIHLTHRHRSFRLEIECKLIDHENGKTVKLYAQQGLARFLRGEYAWATREAFMLAYVRDGSALAASLTPFLERHRRSESDPYHTEDLPVSVGSRTNLARSTHLRTFAYIHQQPPSFPGPIAIWHLWL